MSGAVEGVALLPVAYLHTLHMEGGQTNERLSSWDGVDEYEPSRTAFGFPGRDYSEEYSVTTQPLYTRTTPPARSYADEDVARIIDPDAWLLRAGWIEIAEDPKCAEMRDHWMARADGCVAQSLAKAAAIRLLSQGGKA